MIRKCLLETNGYQTIFNLKSVDKPQADSVELIVEFQLDPRLGELSAMSVPSFIHFKDLHRLVTYFEQHIASLRKDPNSEAHTFVTYGLSFQIQALSGDILCEDEGVFTLRFMVNIGEAYEKASSTYVGGESMMTLANIRSFISSLQLALSELSYSNV